MAQSGFHAIHLRICQFLQSLEFNNPAAPSFEIDLLFTVHIDTLFMGLLGCQLEFSSNQQEIIMDILEVGYHEHHWHKGLF